MALAYLLDPSFQTLNENGRPLVGGHIEVYYHNTSTKYVTKADFEGTDNPFKVPLNSKGMAVIIASDSNAYDVFCYDAFETLFWSRQNVNTIGGGGGGGGGMQPTCKVQYNEDGLDVYNDEFDFVKENVLGNDELSFPRGWYQVNVCVTLENQSARDLIHEFKIDWSFERIENGSPVFFDAHLPDLKTQLDCTTTWKRKLYGSMLFVPYATQDGDWLTYSIDIPSNMTYAIDLDIAKVRDE